MKLSAPQQILISMMTPCVPMGIEQVKEITHKQKVMDALVNKGVVDKVGDKYMLKEAVVGAAHTMPKIKPSYYFSWPQEGSYCRIGDKPESPNEKVKVRKRKQLDDTELKKERGQVAQTNPACMAWK